MNEENNSPGDTAYQADTKAAKRAARRLSTILTTFTTLHSQMNVSTAKVFLLVAQHEGYTGVELHKISGIPIPSMSRYLLDLSSKTRRKGGQALGLVEDHDDPEDLRIKRYYLTPKGRSILNQITSLLEE